MLRITGRNSEPRVCSGIGGKRYEKVKSNENMKISSVLQGKETSERKKEIEKRESEKKSGQAKKNMKRVVGRIEDSMSSTQKEQIAKFRLTIIRLEI